MCKKNVLTGVLLAMAIVVLATASANAGVIVEEQFIYEPPEANIDGQNGGTGFDGPWVSTISHGRIYWIRSPGLEFSTLPVAGNALSRFGSAGRAQAHRLLSSESKAALTRDGTTIWFSVLFQEPANQYRHGSFLFGTEPFTTDGTPTLAAAGDGFGFTIQAAPDGSTQGTGTINALAFNGSTAPIVVQGTFTPDPITATSLIVGKINWKPSGIPDELFLFNVTDLSTEPLESAAIASITNLDFDQSAFDIVAMWDSNNAITDEIRFGNTFANVMGMPGEPTAASNPNPANEATDVPRDVSLSWTPGEFAAPTNGHKVYFGESFNDVNDATGGIAQDANSYTPAQRLDFGTTYYWRVDEVNAPPTSHIEFKGEVWQFTTEPVGYPIDGNNITATASSSDAGQGPENTVNRSGLDADDLHSVELTDMWLSNANGSQPTWIQYEFDKVYKLHQMWVWNHNTAFEVWVGFGLKDVTIEYSTNGTDWTVLGGVPDFAQGLGAEGYAHNTTIDFDGAVAKYVKITANSSWGDLAQYGLSEVRFFYIPVWAREPNPTSGATDVDLDVVLSWRAGREAASHDVYLSTSRQAVINGTAPVNTLTEASYGPLSLDLGKTYYWRVDEVNDLQTPTTWKGDVWNFRTHEFIAVDDFESYDDYDNRIFYSWRDGWGFTEPAPGYPGNGTGSTVGYAQAPFAEQTIVHGGRQSMPLAYDNTGTAGKARYSETQREWASPQDWTKADVKALTLWFHGETDNTPETLYVAVEDSAAQVRVATHPNPEVLQGAGWQEWNVPLQQFSGVNLTSVKKMYIGLGNRVSPQAGGTGTIFIDDIRVYPARCVPSLGKPAADLSGNCIVDHADVEIISDQWLDSGFVVTPTDPGNSSLIAHYPFNGNANDVVGGNNGTTAGMVSYGTGKIDQAIILDGVDDYVDCGAGASLNITGAVTVSAWIRLSAVGVDHKIAGNQDGTTGGYKLGVFNSDVIEFEIRTSANAAVLNRSVAGGTALAAGTWYHVAGVYSEGNYIRTYVNGLLDREMATTEILGSSTGTLKMGREPFSDLYFFNGLMDEVRIYNRALSDGEVAWLAAHTSPISIAADLHQDDVIDFKDLAVLGDSWLEELLWP